MAGENESVLFLDKNRLFFYTGNTVSKLDVPTNTIRDLDVVDKNGLDTLIDTFIKSRKLGPTRLILVLSDSICFSKDFTETDPTKLDNQIKDFLEAVPFDQVVSKRYKSQTGVRIISTNYELLEAIGEVFERDGFGLDAIVPSAIFPGYNTKKILDVDFGRFVLANRGLVRQSNMLQKIETPVATPAENTQVPKKSKLLPYLLVGFGVLIAILVGVILMRMRQ